MMNDNPMLQRLKPRSFVPLTARLKRTQHRSCRTDPRSAVLHSLQYPVAY